MFIFCMGFEISLSVTEFDNKNNWEKFLLKAILNKISALVCFMSVCMKRQQELPNVWFTESDITIIEFQLIFSDDGYWHNFWFWYDKLYGKFYKQATYLQMNDTHTTH